MAIVVGNSDRRDLGRSGFHPALRSLLVRNAGGCISSAGGKPTFPRCAFRSTPRCPRSGVGVLRQLWVRGGYRLANSIQHAS
jgi:hypothetical protein